MILPRLVFYSPQGVTVNTTINKATYGPLAGALTTGIVYALASQGIEMDDTTAGALAIIIGWAISAYITWRVPNKPA